MGAPRKNYDAAVERYRKGESVPAIAADYGIAHQVMYKILKRRGCEIRPLKRGRDACTVPGCGELQKARGLCSRHSAQFYAHGKVISAEKIKVPNGNRKCSVPGCEREHVGRGCCQGHLMQLRKHGKTVSEALAPRVGVMAYGDYVFIKAPDHPCCNKDGYVKRANLVWEEMTGQVVVPPALVHHKNGHKKDDSFENLEYFPSDLEHQKAHHVRMGVRGFIPGGIC